MKILVSVAMSNTKSVAENYLTAQLPQVLENLVKIFLFAKSSTTREWIDEIADKHIRPISRCVNNVKTKKGHLSKSIIIKVWHEIFRELNVRKDLRAVSRNKSYSKMIKYKFSEQDLENLISNLSNSDIWFADNILIDDLDQDDVIANHLAEIALKHQN